MKGKIENKRKIYTNRANIETKIVKGWVNIVVSQEREENGGGDTSFLTNMKTLQKKLRKTPLTHEVLPIFKNDGKELL